MLKQLLGASALRILTNNSGFATTLKRLSALLAALCLPLASMANDREAVYQKYMDFGALVDGGEVTPGWMLAGPEFWYAQGGPQDREILRVDPAENSIAPLFDVPRLRAALTEVLGYEPAGQGVPFAQLTFVAPKQVRFRLEGANWLLNLDSYDVTKQPALSHFDMTDFLISEQTRVTPRPFYQESFTGLGPTQTFESASPDFKWFASTKDNNVALRASVDGRYVMLTEDGTNEQFWLIEAVKWQPWSPDAQRLVAIKSDTTGMKRIPTIKWLKPLEESTEVLTIPAGGKLNRDELFILNVQGGDPIKVDTGDTTDQYIRPLTWTPDGSELIFARYDRLMTQVEIMGANPSTGEARVIMTEVSETFLTNQHETIWATDTGFWLLPDGSGFIWRSERDGWDHLYHYDMNGKLERRLTRGDFPVIAVTHVDQAGGWVYFQAHGDQDRPYDNHLYRVSLKGGKVAQLTEGNGRHTINMAPGVDYFTDTFSSVDVPPETVLRAADGTLVRSLGKADLSRLQQVGWVPPREVVVKAADGETDLWATIYYPYDFDPAKKYPVVEYIYAGPQTTWRTMDFGIARGMFAGVFNFNRALAQQGFITLTLDGRGTPGRSKAFHDVVYRNWGQFEIDDHAGAIKQLGERFGYMDLDRVGIMGASWGGHFTFRALVQAPDVYKAGISEVPGYDSRSFTLYEVYLGLPADNKDIYDKADALPLAPQLKGKLLLTGGLNDTGTQKDYYKMSEGLIRAGIQHDTMTYPNSGHGYFGKSAVYNFELKKNWLIEQLKP
ncbi:MAG: DPP IV N-terminal domain-containing protein [Kiritimatiellia bacterium]|jgi:dipeptidyl aminopeptidase/acylaminoacyl peptidase|nr:DPP IV N-terminal domain-containing protein [Kiritimatiellia bacterium]